MVRLSQQYSNTPLIVHVRADDANQLFLIYDFFELFAYLFFTPLEEATLNCLPMKIDKRQ